MITSFRFTDGAVIGSGEFVNEAFEGRGREGRVKSYRLTRLGERRGGRRAAADCAGSASEASLMSATVHSDRPMVSKTLSMSSRAVVKLLST